MESLLREEKKIFITVIIFLTIYSMVFMFRSSFDINGERYFSLFDDAMISMTYAKNLAHGDGLVWNKGGERVEGFTNPLWVAYMALFHMLPLPLSKTSLCIQITGCGLLLLTIVYVRKIALVISNNSSMTASISILLTGLYYPLIYWNLMGLEVSILMLITVIAVWKSLTYINDIGSPLTIYLILGISTFIRIDMAVTFLGFWLFFVVTKPKQRWKNILAGVIILGIFIGAQTLFRLWYFGDILPNTYYLKMTGGPAVLRIAHGVLAYLTFALRMNVIALAVPVIYVLYTQESNKRLLAWIFFVQSLYSIYVGGDSWEEWGGSNRFISIAMPLYFILFAALLLPMRKILNDCIRNAKNIPESLRRLSLKYMFSLIVFASLVHFNYPVLYEFLMLSKSYQVTYNREMVERSLIIQSLTNKNAKVAVTWAGAIPYFSGRQGLDMLGKCDTFIAHSTNRIGRTFSELLHYKPGHMKWDYDYTFNKLRPDIVPRLWGGDIDEMLAVIDEDYDQITIYSDDISHNFWIRKDAENLNWDRIKKMHETGSSNE